MWMSSSTPFAGMLGRQLPKVEAMLREAANDITAFADFPVPHWKKIWSTNPLERLNKEIKRRTDRRQSSVRGLPLLQTGARQRLQGVGSAMGGAVTHRDVSVHWRTTRTTEAQRSRRVVHEELSVAVIAVIRDRCRRRINHNESEARRLDSGPPGPGLVTQSARLTLTTERK